MLEKQRGISGCCQNSGISQLLGDALRSLGTFHQQHTGCSHTYLNVSFLTVRLAVSISLLVLAFFLLTGGAFSFVSAPVPVLPPLSIPVLLTILILLLLFLVTKNITENIISSSLVAVLNCLFVKYFHELHRSTHRLGDGDLDGLLLGDRDALRLRLCLLREKKKIKRIRSGNKIKTIIVFWI